MTRQPADLLFTAAVCQAEILSGIAVLPKGRRREALEMAALAMFRRGFCRSHPALRSADAAAIYGELFALRRSAGRPGGDSRSDDRLDRPRAMAPASSSATRRISRVAAWGA